MFKALKPLTSKILISNENEMLIRVRINYNVKKSIKYSFPFKSRQKSYNLSTLSKILREQKKEQSISGFIKKSKLLRKNFTI